MTVIGIDLGTSNTVVAHFKDGEPATLCDPAGRRLIPSVVSFHPSGTVLVGDAAKMRRFNDSANTVTGAKRLMGRTWGTPELEELRKRLPYQLREGKNKTVRALLRGELYAIPELSAFVLRKAKAWAEEALGEKVTEAVITVPANFHELQRQATKLAGELAGLEVMRVLNEPTAAALAYGHIAPAARDEQIAVYDFGGGTFDLTMLKMSESELRVRATAGDMFLGGDDIDTAIATRIADAYLKHHYYDPRADPDVFARVRVAAERLKVALSDATEATVPLNELMYGPGGKPIQWSYSMTRKDLDALIDPFINRSFTVCEDALERLNASPREFDRIVLVGGTSLSPRVRERVADFFGRDPVPGIDPEEAVALGAAISGTIPVARTAKPVKRASPALLKPVVDAVAGEDYPAQETFQPMADEDIVAAARPPAKRQSLLPRGRRIILAAVGIALGVAAGGVMVWRHARTTKVAPPVTAAPVPAAAAPASAAAPTPSPAPVPPSAAAPPPSAAPPAAAP